MREGTIYGLVDPRNGVIRYVGQTMNPMQQRLSEHISFAGAGGRTHSAKWIRKLLRCGERPFAVVLQRASEDHLSEAERVWIAHMRAVVGNRILTNITDGGERPTMPPETRERIRLSRIGRRMTESSREKMRRSALARWERPEEREHLSRVHRGRRPSEETLRKMRGRRSTPETKARISAALRGRVIPPEEQERQRLGALRWWAERKALAEGEAA